MWWGKHRSKVITAFLIAAVLAAAFYYGGNAPRAGGWCAAEEASRQLSGTVAGITSEAPSLEPIVEPEDSALQTDSVQPPTIDPTQESEQQAAIVVPSTMPDPAQTTQTPAEEAQTTGDMAELTCTISISCATIWDNIAYLDKAKTELVPDDGWLLAPITVSFYEGESVFNVLQRTCKQSGIHMEYRNTPLYNSAYIEGIGNLYELDAGDLSGWMYQVNGVFPNYGCSRYPVQDGDVICWVYTCDGGSVGVGGQQDE